MYKEKTYIAGETIEVEKLHSNQFLPKGGRAKRVKATPESVKKHNEKISEDKFRRKMKNIRSWDYYSNICMSLGIMIKME